MLHESENEYILLTNEKLNLEFAYNFVVEPWTGGTSIFIGTTRNCFENKKVKTLYYEAYEEMAIKEMIKICDTVKLNFNVCKICMMHRLDEVPVLEASIIIVMSSVHRADAIKAVAFAIDELKSTVPIWKKEIYEQHESEWKENKEIFWKK